MSKSTSILLREASAEIRNLRRENEALRARVDTFDACVAMFFGEPPRRGGGMSPDVAWALDKAASEIEAAPEPAEPSKETTQ